MPPTNQDEVHSHGSAPRTPGLETGRRAIKRISNREKCFAAPVLSTAKHRVKPISGKLSMPCAQVANRRRLKVISRRDRLARSPSAWGTGRGSWEAVPVDGPAVEADPVLQLVGWIRPHTRTRIRTAADVSNSPPLPRSSCLDRGGRSSGLTRLPALSGMRGFDQGVHACDEGCGATVSGPLHPARAALPTSPFTRWTG
jgi:hypothetical protein